MRPVQSFESAKEIFVPGVVWRKGITGLFGIVRGADAAEFVEEIKRINQREACFQGG
jgi:hypothetical protein